jgi:hypothetical protein
MLIEALVIPEGTNPSWENAQAWIDGLSDSDLQDLAEQSFDWLIEDLDEGAEPVRVALREVLEDLRKAFAFLDTEGEHAPRELGWIIVAGHRVYLTGGMSFGDTPTDLFDVFAHAVETGVAEAAGFVEETNAVTLRLPPAVT